MPDRAVAAATVHEILLDLWPGRFAPSQLGDHVSLGESGLALDSIEIVEILLECDERFDDAAPADELLDAGPISIGRVIDHLARR